MPSTTKSIQLILDFDETLTQEDTLAVLGRVTSITGVKPKMTWADIVQAYLADFSTHQRLYTPAPSWRKSISDEAHWLMSLRPIEQASAKRVEDAGTFRGATTASLNRLATHAVQEGNIKLREGWKELFRPVAFSTPIEMSILSVCWSRTFIRAALLAASDKDPDLQSIIRRMTICANEIEGLNRQDGSTGGLDSTGGIRVSGDKLRHMRETGSSKTFTVYVGDSMTDLECLVTADVGICVQDHVLRSGQKELAACLDRVGYNLIPLDEASLWNRRPSTLYRTTSLEAVARYLARLSEAEQVP